MKWFCAVLFAALLALPAVYGQEPPAAPAGASGLEELKKQFETSFRDLLRQERDATQALSKKYLQGLTALEESLQAAGNQLSAVIAVRGEKTRFEQSADIPEGALATDLPALRKLQEAWCSQSAELPRTQAQKIVTLTERYLQNLANLQKALVAKNDTNSVNEVRQETDRLLSNSRVREALALLKTATPTTPPEIAKNTPDTAPATGPLEVDGYMFYPPGKEPKLRNSMPLRLEVSSFELRTAQFLFDLRVTTQMGRQSAMLTPRIAIAAKNRDIAAGSKLVLEYFHKTYGRVSNPTAGPKEEIFLPKIARGQAYVVDSTQTGEFYGLVITLWDENGAVIYQLFGPAREAVLRRSLHGGGK